MSHNERKNLIKVIVQRRVNKKVNVSAFAPETALVDNSEFSVSREPEETEETDMGQFISRELAEVEHEPIMKRRETDYSWLDTILMGV